MSRRIVMIVLNSLMSLILWGAAIPGWTLELEGQRIQGGLLIGRVSPGTSVTFKETSVRVSPEGIFVIGLDRDEPQHTVIELHHPDGKIERYPLRVSQRQYSVQKIDGIPKEKVEPTDPKTLERIRIEAAMLKKARQRDDPRIDFSKGFIAPVRGRISGVYGSQRILNGKPRQPHYGIDISVPEGTPVKAPADGVVSLVHPDMFFTGGTLILDHGHGVSSAFLHLQTTQVQEGQSVKQGDVIARVGATGRVTGAHLDWRVNWFSVHLDPALLVPELSEDSALESKP